MDNISDFRSPARSWHEGTTDNSPTFSTLGVEAQYVLSPEGTIEVTLTVSAVPSGLGRLLRKLPKVETLVYCRGIPSG